MNKLEKNYEKYMSGVDVFEYICQKYTEKISWLSISKNPHVTLDLIKKYFQKDITYLSATLVENPNIPLSFFEQCDVPNIYKFLHRHPNLNWDFVKKHLDKDWNWPNLVERDFIHWEHIVQSPYLYNVSYLSFNITPKIIKEYNLDELPGFSYTVLSANKHLTWDFIFENFNEMNLYLISMHPVVTWEIICEHPDLNWNWVGISRNPNITFDIIIKNPEKPWAWWYVGANKNITPKIIDENPHIEWDWSQISYNPNLTSSFIKKHRDKNWNERAVMKFLNWSDICEMGWEQTPYILEYPYLCVEILEQFYLPTEKINWYIAKNHLFKTPFVRERCMKIIQAYRRYKLRKRLPLVASKYRIAGEIKFMPNIGEEFFKIKEELEKLSF